MFLVLTALPLHAQTVRGRLLERGTERPIVAGLIVLMDSASTEVDRAISDQNGLFTLNALIPGSFYVRAEGLGYQTKTDGILELGEGGLISIDFYLRPSPLKLDSLQATVDQKIILAGERRFLEGQGFYDRLESGFGDFITPEELELRRPNDSRSLFEGHTAIRVGTGAWAGQQLVRFKVAGRFCSPGVYVDGALAAFAGRLGEVVLEDVVQVEDILAVEIYRHISSIPLQYNVAGRNTSCGVLLVWTK